MAARMASSSCFAVGGFASTLAFPAVAWLIANLQWRGALQSIGIVLVQCCILFGS